MGETPLPVAQIKEMWNHKRVCEHIRRVDKNVQRWSQNIREGVGVPLVYASVAYLLQYL